MLSDDELERLISEFSEKLVYETIEDLSSYMESTGRVYKSHYAVIRRWIRENLKKGEKTDESMSAEQDELSELNKFV